MERKAARSVKGSTGIFIIEARLTVQVNYPRLNKHQRIYKALSAKPTIWYLAGTQPTYSLT